jgi:SAM-dependent methyltransferase
MKAEGQSDLNARFWASADHVRDYAKGDLRAPEAALLRIHRGALAGGVLELGSGAGRVTRHLIALADRVDAVEISAAMIAHARARYPEAQYRQGDLSDLSAFEDGSFDAVVAAYGVLDVLDDLERRRALEEFARVLVDGGLLIVSSHNLGYAPNIREPTRIFARSPVHMALNLLRMRRRVANRRRLLRFERMEPEYAILVDEGHDYSLLHYYISRDAQERQFCEHGFELLDCLDLDGEPVRPGQAAERCPELHYAARREPRQTPI